MMKLSGIPRRTWYGILFPLVLVFLGVWLLWPKIENYRLREERSVMRGLQHLGLNEVVFRELDRDGNKVYDFWTGDVADLEKVRPDEVRSIARADTAPLEPRVSQPVPFHGYYFEVLKRDLSSGKVEEYQQDTDGSGRKVHHFFRYGICAYPAEYDWRHRRTFIINEAGLYSVDNGGKQVVEWPSQATLEAQFTDEHGEWWVDLR